MQVACGPHFGKSRVQAWGQEKEQERETKPWTCSLGTSAADAVKCILCAQLQKEVLLSLLIYRWGTKTQER